MGLDLEYIGGQTPLDEDEKEGLLIETIATRSELDEFEQKNIEEAVQWSLGRKFSIEDICSENFVRSLHRRMFEYVWSWAGSFRDTNKNLGVDKWLIPTQLKQLCDDAIYWDEHEIYCPEEIAIRFKHGIVSIHCFPNGNGRHSRLIADLIAENHFGLEPFSWGAGQINREGDVREEYLSALRQADRGEFDDLMKFARS